LVAAAVEANPDHQALRAFAVEIGAIAAPPSSPTQSRYRTLIVDQLHRGDYPTISEAIAAARPGDRIIVRPGTYTEGLVIDKPLEIIGDGDRAEIVVRAIGKPVILFQTTAGRVQNLTLRQDGGLWFGVDIKQGRLELEDCDISSVMLACVAIHDGADPRLRRNRIHDGKAGGVYIYHNGQGILEDNDIFANALAGVAIQIYGNPMLRGNRINKNNLQAIHIENGAAGTFENNDLRDNGLGAWDIAPQCLPNVQRSGNIE